MNPEGICYLKGSPNLEGYYNPEGFKDSGNNELKYDYLFFNFFRFDLYSLNDFDLLSVYGYLLVLIPFFPDNDDLFEAFADILPVVGDDVIVVGVEGKGIPAMNFKTLHVKRRHGWRRWDRETFQVDRFTIPACKDTHHFFTFG